MLNQFAALKFARGTRFCDSAVGDYKPAFEKLCPVAQKKFEI